MCGSQVPGNLKNKKKNEAVVKELLGNCAIRRFAGHASGKSAFKGGLFVLTPSRHFPHMGPTALRLLFDASYPTLRGDARFFLSKF